MHTNRIKFCAKDVAHCNILNADFLINSKNTVFISGFVSGPNGEPLKNCAIAVNSISNNSIDNSIKTFVGVTFTDDTGSYGLALNTHSNFSYELTAYSNSE